MQIGILALQGAFIEHGTMLDKLGIDHFYIRNREDLSREMNGLILPGGESTVQGHLLSELNMYDSIADMISSSLPVLGTCAGLILMAKNIVNDNASYFRNLNVSVRRNAYGRQLGSFYTESDFAGMNNVPMTFIRAPYIEEVYEGAIILATVDGHIVGVRQDNIIGISFHPELNSDTRIHSMFADICRSAL